MLGPGSRFDSRTRCGTETRAGQALDYVLRSDDRDWTAIECGCLLEMSCAPQLEKTNSTTAELTWIERPVGFLDAAKLSEDWIAGMQECAVMLEAHDTTPIEGTQLTLEQSESIPAGSRWATCGSR
jgi:hypothetical protein